jgi:hypothetical protein
MKAFTALLIGLFMSMTAYAGEGLPLPWPFPWAKECPVEWMSMEGKYAMADSSRQEQLDISFHTVTKGGYKLARVARLDKDGALIAEGFNVVTANQRTLRLFLFPLDRTQSTESVVIKLYYQSSSSACSAQNLVPIMSVEKRGSSTTGTTNYRLVKEEQPN